MTLFTQIIIAIIAIALGYWLGCKFSERRGRTGSATPKLLASAGVVAKQQREKDENLNQLREHIRGKGEITNDDVEELLGVSDSTAERYLSDLVEEGLLVQEGDTGRLVRYRAQH